MRNKIIFLCGACLILFAGTVSRTQTPTPSPKECTVPIAGKVDTKLKILAKPDPKFAERERERYRHQTITLRATFCGSGAVTDISVTKGLISEMNTAAIDAAKLIQFNPAEKSGQKVSQILTVKYFVK